MRRYEGDASVVMGACAARGCRTHEGTNTRAIGGTAGSRRRRAGKQDGGTLAQGRDKRAQP